MRQLPCDNADWFKVRRFDRRISSLLFPLLQEVPADPPNGPFPNIVWIRLLSVLGALLVLCNKGSGRIHRLSWVRPFPPGKKEKKKKKKKSSKGKLRGMYKQNDT